jgi:hypothetical protein
MSKWACFLVYDPRPKVRVGIVLAVLAALALAVPGSVAVQGENWTAVALDPAGDAFGLSPQHDATELSISTDGTYLELTLSFVGEIAYWGGGPNAVGGYVDLDTDQHAHTGAASNVSSYPQCGASNLGIEFYVDLFSYST